MSAVRHLNFLQKSRVVAHLRRQEEVLVDRIDQQVKVFLVLCLFRCDTFFVAGLEMLCHLSD